MTNLYHDPKGWWPKGSNGERARSAFGLLKGSSGAIRIFMNHRWQWGGWEATPDYMHFGKVTVGDNDNPLECNVWASQLQFAPD